jgi:hypothetical protein
MYDEAVAYLKKGKIAAFVCAAGLMAHYAGDSCQPLHISQFHDGEHEADRGVHSAYETQMLDSNRAELVEGVNRALNGWRAKPEIKGGHAAAVRTVKLMRAAHSKLPPREIIEVFREASGPKAMWEPLREKTIATLVQGCKNLAVLWETAWEEGGRSKIAAADLQAIPKRMLTTLYNRRDFAEAMWLDEMIAKGIGVRGEE